MFILQVLKRQINTVEGQLISRNEVYLCVLVFLACFTISCEGDKRLLLHICFVATEFAISQDKYSCLCGQASVEEHAVRFRPVDVYVSKPDGKSLQDTNFLETEYVNGWCKIMHLNVVNSLFYIL